MSEAPEEQMPFGPLERELRKACEAGDEARLAELLSLGARARAVKGLFPVSPLRMAISADSVACVRLLLPLVDSHELDNFGVSPLEAARLWGREDCARAIQAHHAAMEGREIASGISEPGATRRKAPGL